MDKARGGAETGVRTKSANQPPVTIKRPPILIFAGDERGGLAAWFAVMLVPLLFFAGVGLDLSRGYNQKAELQGAVDAAALAGAGLYTSAAALATATAGATTYMNNFKASSGLTALSFTVTPGTVTTGSSVTLYKMTVAATSQITNTLMAMAQKTQVVNATATAQNPVYNITISAANFNSSAADLDTISYYVVPPDNSLPTTTTLLYSNASTNNASSITIQLTASQRIGFLLTNTTGGKPVTTCILFICTTITSNYGFNQYGGSYGTTHLFYSHLYPPSRIAYPGNPSNNCSLQVLTNSAAPQAGSCLNTLSQYSTVNCVQSSGLTLYFYWNDMGGPLIDDKDFNDATYVVSCSKAGTNVSKGLVLTN
jgi:Flp pilus assembly protein TadG